jgi:molybdopterin synthase catalytic subunit
MNPVSVVRLCAIRETALSIDEVFQAVGDPGSGGIVLFTGVVRDNDEDRSVVQLGYSAHPTAERELRVVAEETATKYPDVRAIAATHRVGDLGIGELAVVVAVSAPHRGEAFEACRYLIDELKARVPLWKHQRFTDGEASWVGAE